MNGFEMRIHCAWRLLVLFSVAALFGCRQPPAPGAAAAAQLATSAHLAPNPTQAQTRAWLVSGNYPALNAAFSAIQAEYRTGVRSDESLYVAFLALHDDDDSLRAAYDGWVRAYPSSYVALLARAIYHRKVGQERRGEASIGETSEIQLQGMNAEYKLALQDLIASKALDTRPLLTLSNQLDIVANYDDSATMRAILNESKKMDPENIVVRRLYLSYLEPRWGGSELAMRAFVLQSQLEGLPDAKRRSLEAVIVSDHAHTAETAGDDATAEREYRQALELGDDACSRCLALVLVREHKYAEAVPVLTMAIGRDPSNKELLYWRAVAYLAIGKDHEGLADMLEAAKLGELDAQNRVGVWYMTGFAGGLTPDPGLGLKWLRQCAAQRNVNCTHNLQLALQQNPP
jgi:tetratricopeptide (TPR) repeat protein